MLCVFNQCYNYYKFLKGAIKMKKKIITLSLISSLVLGSLPTSVLAEEVPSVNENLYLHVNKEWIDQAEIPADRPMTGAFDELNEKVEDILKADIAKFVSGELTAPNKEIEEFVKLYKLAGDFERRESEGVTPIQSTLEELKALTYEDFNNNLLELSSKGIPAPLYIGVGVKFEDTNVKQLDLGSPGLILPDTTMYDDPATSEALLDAYRTSTLKVLTLAGIEQADAEKLVENTIKFDASIKPFMMSAEELSDFTKQNNPRTLEELAAYSPDLKLDEVVKELVGDVEVVNIATLKYYENFASVVNEETFPLVKDWMITNYVLSAAPYLTDELRVAAGEYSRMVQGVAEASPKEDTVYNYATGIFSEVIGKYYGETYFGEEAKKEVENMMKEFIAVYRGRLEKNDWLSPETKDFAILKLDNMTYHVGYPDKISETYSKIKVDPEKSLYEANLEISNMLTDEQFAQYHEPVDKSEWGIPASMVNAFYDAAVNGIYFPAAILQAPFYSKDQSKEANYGGIGAVIAHEITHAFDTNGAQFDEQGNFKNWWKEEDFAAFQERADKMAEQWNGFELNGNPVNGQLTVTENIADAGGLSASLEALKGTGDVNLEEFFLSWARIWRQKATPEIEQLLLTMDTHAPNELRANIQVRYLDEFYETFDVKEGDPMYLAPEERMSIW